MTLHIADIAKWQGSLELEELRAAGFEGINVKISHGLTQKSVHPNVAMYVQKARALGMTIGAFHWLDGSASGQAQAAYAYERMQALPGGAHGLAHTVDVEDTLRPPTFAIWRDYVVAFSALLGRPIATYSGRWWWARYAAGWQPLSASPWLWSAPATGYPGRYTGDLDEAMWAGYGPWPELAVQQYAVKPAAGIKVSMSAVRSEDVWAQMRGEAMATWENTPASNSLLAELNAAFPNRDKGTDGTIGDPAHAQRSSDHNPDETGATPYEDADSINEVHARDAGDRLNRPGWTMARVVSILVDRHRRGLDNRLQNIIHHGKVISRSWGWSEWRPSNGHETWAHFGFRYGSGSGQDNPENNTKPWGILAAIEEEDGVSVQDVINALNSDAGQQAIGRATLNRAETEEVIRDVFASDAFADAFRVAMEARTPMVIPRLADRGWGGTAGMSIRQLAEYAAEQLYAGSNVDLNNDGTPAESGSLQSALADLRQELADLRAAVNALTPPPAPPAPSGQ